MKVFTFNESITIVCDSKSTSNGFKHVATLLVMGQERLHTKICYLNRTWERYQYESVLSNILHASNMLRPEAIKEWLSKQC